MKYQIFTCGYCLVTIYINTPTVSGHLTNITLINIHSGSCDHIIEVLTVCINIVCLCFIQWGLGFNNNYRIMRTITMLILFNYDCIILWRYLLYTFPCLKIFDDSYYYSTTTSYNVTIELTVTDLYNIITSYMHYITKEFIWHLSCLLVLNVCIVYS